MAYLLSVLFPSCFQRPYQQLASEEQEVLSSDSLSVLNDDVISYVFSQITEYKSFARLSQVSRRFYRLSEIPTNCNCRDIVPDFLATIPGPNWKVIQLARQIKATLLRQPQGQVVFQTQIYLSPYSLDHPYFFGEHGEYIVHKIEQSGTLSVSHRKTNKEKIIPAHKSDIDQIAFIEGQPPLLVTSSDAEGVKLWDMASIMDDSVEPLYQFEGRRYPQLKGSKLCLRKENDFEIYDTKQLSNPPLRVSLNDFQSGALYGWQVFPDHLLLVFKRAYYVLRLQTIVQVNTCDNRPATKQDAIFVRTAVLPCFQGITFKIDHFAVSDDGELIYVSYDLDDREKIPGCFPWDGDTCIIGEVYNWKQNILVDCVKVPTNMFIRAAFFHDNSLFVYDSRTLIKWSQKESTPLSGGRVSWRHCLSGNIQCFMGSIFIMGEDSYEVLDEHTLSTVRKVAIKKPTKDIRWTGSYFLQGRHLLHRCYDDVTHRYALSIADVTTARQVVQDKTDEETSLLRAFDKLTL